MMQITQATPAGASGPTSLNTEWLLTAAGDGSGLRYQQLFTLELPTGGLAEELLIDDSTVLRLRPHHLISNALDNSTPEKAKVDSAGNTGLRVTLPIPRLIHSIRFSVTHSPNGKTTQLFRTDGDTVAEEPIASRFNSVSIKKNAQQDNPGIGDFSVTKADATTSGKGNTELLSATGITHSLPTGELGVTDGRIVVRLLGTDYETLNPASITEFNLSTGPENLRVGIRLPALGSDLFYLPVTLELEQSAHLGDSLRNQLADLIRRLSAQLAASSPESAPPPILPNPLVAELVVESDAPCRFTISQFAVRYRLARHTFPGGEPKQVLRFTGGRLSQQRLGFEVPSSATLTSAVLKLAGDGSEPIPGDSAAASSGHLNGLISMAGDNGLRLDGDHSWSSPIELSEPMLSGGWDLLLGALAKNTQLHLDIVADSNGAPGGERLASAEARLPSPGRPKLVRFDLDTPLMVQPGTYWLTLASRDGVAVWYLEPRPGARAVPPGGDEANGTVIDDQAGIANWIAADGPAAVAQSFPEITLDGQPLPLSTDGNDWVYDLVPALGTSPISGSGLLARELSVLASGPKPVTVYAPRIEFELLSH